MTDSKHLERQTQRGSHSAMQCDDCGHISAVDSVGCRTASGLSTNEATYFDLGYNAVTSMVERFCWHGWCSYKWMETPCSNRTASAFRYTMGCQSWVASTPLGEIKLTGHVQPTRPPIRRRPPRHRAWDTVVR